MRQKLTLITLGVRNFQKALNFYEGLGWQKSDKSMDDYVRVTAARVRTMAESDRFFNFFDLKKDDYKPYQYMADTYAEMGQEDKALECNEIYMSHNQNATPSDYAKLANIYVQMAEKGGAKKQANLDKAYGIYTQMAEKWPTIAAWVYNMAGMQSSKAGQDEKGAEFFQKAVDLLANKTDRQDDETSTLKSALANLGYYYWVTKSNLESAKPYYEQLIKLDPNDKNARAALGLDSTEAAPQQ